MKVQGKQSNPNLLGVMHVRRDKTIQNLVNANIWWPRMNIDARQFVKTCAQCQRGNTRFDKAATKLHPIPIPSKVW